MDSVYGDWSLSSRVSPFRHLRIDGYLLLPAAFRSLSRLSSALSAKASTLRSYSLDLVFGLSLYSVITNCVYLVVISRITLDLSIYSIVNLYRFVWMIL